MNAENKSIFCSLTNRQVRVAIQTFRLSGIGHPESILQRDYSCPEEPSCPHAGHPECRVGLLNRR